MLHAAICDDDKILLENLGREVKLWAREEHAACTVEIFATADAFLFAWEMFQDVSAFSFPLGDNGTCRNEAAVDQERLKVSLQKAELWEKVQTLEKNEAIFRNHMDVEIKSGYMLTHVLSDRKAAKVLTGAITIGAFTQYAGALKKLAKGFQDLVGKNGAGKTTFIKLLCRLYEPICNLCVSVCTQSTDCKFF